MSDQTPTPVHVYRDDVAQAEIANLKQQRREDKDQWTAAMSSTNDILGKLDEKTDRILDTQAEHGKQIAVLCAKEEAQKVPPWLKAVIGAVVAAVLAAGGYGVNEVTQPPQTQTTEAGR